VVSAALFRSSGGIVFLILMQCMRHLRWFEWRERPVGLALVRAVSLIYLATVVLRIAIGGGARASGKGVAAWRHGAGGHCEGVGCACREDVVLVKYAADFDLDREWVYNGADIDGQKIVWARDMGPEKNQELLDYYRGRKFWIVEADGEARLEPYQRN
jgi:hypothetical protein